MRPQSSIHFWKFLKINDPADLNCHFTTRRQISGGYRELTPSERACAPTHSSKPQPWAPPPGTRLKPGPVFFTSGGVKIRSIFTFKTNPGSYDFSPALRTGLVHGPCLAPALCTTRQIHRQLSALSEITRGDEGARCRRVYQIKATAPLVLDLHAAAL